VTARAEIDLGAIRRNIGRLGALAPAAAVCAVVKADGYGHGAVAVARAALAGGADWLAVATPAEASALAAAGIGADTPILLLSEPDPDAVADAWADRPQGLRVTVASAAGVAVLRGLVAGARPVPVHVLIDTGMHRMGVAPGDAVALLDLVEATEGLELEGVWTHFAVADDPGDDFTATQIARFDDTMNALRRAGHRPALQHLCNSAGVIAHPRAHRDLLRVGIAIYGVAPSPALSEMVHLEPALRLTATVTGVREVAAGESVAYGRAFFASQPTRVATLDIGYADGIRRSSPAAGVEALVGGRRVPMLGVVTMDQTMVAVGDHVAIGDEAVLIGVQGEESISAEEIAGRLGTIGYEVLTDLGSRVTRRSVG
jgi:alanine racemase